MKIDISQLSPEGIVFQEEIMPKALDLETEIIKFRTPLKVRAKAAKITNVVTVQLSMEGVIFANCSRCLEEFDFRLKKDTALNYSTAGGPIIELDPDIREEIILDYPLKPLCRPNCEGLCPQCGKNLNEGKCNC